MNRRAKIVCTLGPASGSLDVITALVRGGMDVARLNLSHGSHAEHEQVYRWVRQASDEVERAVGVLVDLQGPKIRLGRIANGPVTLVAGEEFTITTEDVPGSSALVSTTYAGLPGDVYPGLHILVDDGRVTLEVLEVNGPRVRTRVVEGGVISDHKGLNVPGAALSVPALSEKDIEDLRWALRVGADMVALSFVRSPSDYDDVARIMEEEGRRVPVIAKIEKPQAVERLEEITDAFDGFMIARGDLGVEMPIEQVPLVQKRVIAAARRKAKPVIVATQMLDSMMSATRPTRAEVSDCANAVLDGADALMLSGETSVGAHPVLTVQTMARIIERVESEALTELPAVVGQPRTKAGAIAHAAVVLGADLEAKYLVAFTESGDSARRLARYRSPIPLLAFTPIPATRSQLALTWGVETFLVSPVSHTDEMVRQVDRALLDLERCRRGDLVVVIAGTPPGVSGSTNMLRVHRIGDTVDAEVLP
ncbi:MAG: pyruvate kinase [Acidothermus sp.]|nr:pyruvate kinase [Acidothermus sp.]MCL6538848.1 pyruvate kinase [Acidothermus sp.]